MTASHSYSRFQLGNGPLIETKIGHGPPRSSKSKNLTKRKIIPMVMMKKDLQNLQVDVTYGWKPNVIYQLTLYNNFGVLFKIQSHRMKNYYDFTQIS